jgi:hypothetical protein
MLDRAGQFRGELMGCFLSDQHMWHVLWSRSIVTNMGSMTLVSGMLDMSLIRNVCLKTQFRSMLAGCQQSCRDESDVRSVRDRPLMNAGNFERS